MHELEPGSDECEGWRDSARGRGGRACGASRLRRDSGRRGERGAQRHLGRAHLRPRGQRLLDGRPDAGGEAARAEPLRAAGAVRREARSPRQAAPDRARGSATFGADFEQVADPTAPEFRVHGAIFLSLRDLRLRPLLRHRRPLAQRQRRRSPPATASTAAGGAGAGSAPRASSCPPTATASGPSASSPSAGSTRPKQWRASGSENFDVGAMVVGRNEAGEKLVEAVGGAGIAWNLKAGQTFDVHGYPAEAPFDGETQRICRGTPLPRPRRQLLRSSPARSTSRSPAA